MSEVTVFDRLVSDLESSERKALLEKIQHSFSEPQEPLATIPEDETALNPDEELKKFTIIQRFFLFLQSIFTRKDRYTLIQDILLKKTASIIEKRASGLIDFHNSLYNEQMHNELALLKEHTLFFQAPLRSALVNNKHAFFTFLAGLELELVQFKLINETDPFSLWDTGTIENPAAVKHEMRKIAADIFQEIPIENKQRVYLDAQSLSALFHLSNHPFDTMLTTFKSGKCTFRDLDKYLMPLADLLKALEFTPSVDALKALFLFHYKERLDDEDFFLEEMLYRKLSEAKTAIKGIGSFNERIPLVSMIRYTKGNLDYCPQKRGGGEDWFVIYKDFWHRRLENRYKEFYWQHEHERLKNEAADFIGGYQLPQVFKNRAIWPDGRINYCLSLSFLKAVLEKIFQKHQRVLKLIFLKGEFYKEENRQAFTDTLEGISNIDTRILLLAGSLEPDGEPGGKLKKIYDETVKSESDKQVIMDIFVRVNKEALAIIEQAGTHLQAIAHILGGILHGEPGSKFDTLSNLASVGGRENKKLISSWHDILDQIIQSMNLLIEIKELESNRSKSTAVTP
jgi:hypothetical protein